MALPASGAISLNAVNVELGLTGTTAISMNQTSVRTLLGKASGAISLSDGYGKANRSTITYTFAANTQNASLNVTSGTAPAGGSVSGTYVAGKTDVNITVVSAVYLHSVTAGTPGLTLTGGTTGDTITLTNNGYIMGRGGNGGGNTGSTSAYTAPLTGGTALKVGFNTTVVKGSGSYIGGGGGGGGGGISVSTIITGGGGGAGGGLGGTSYNQNNSTVISGGLGGALNGFGGAGTGTGSGLVYAGGGGGGRIFPSSTAAGTTIANGTGGTGGPGGSGGGAGACSNYGVARGGGGGGGWGASGGTGVQWSAQGSTSLVGGYGGGLGNAGGIPSYVGNTLTVQYTAAGAAGGKAIDFNGFTVSISGSGTTYGATS